MSPANISIYDYMGDRNERNIFLSPVNEDEVIRVVRMCANKNSSDNDGITMKIVKHVITSIAQPFTYICNMSFTTGVFPDKMKIAKVVPLYKSGDRHMCNNYRPISLLPQFSKVLEKLFSTRLDSFVKDCDLLSASQYGFRQAMSTCHALVDLVETVTSSLDNKLHTIGIFIDLKKAFDTVDHSLLCKKLEFYGIRGVAYNWVKSYLDYRNQYVSIDGYKSNVRSISCGVPHGSILGQKMFIMYINDMCNISKIIKFILFADDTNILCSDSNITRLSERVCGVLATLDSWFAINKLSLNITKTNFMLFGKRLLNTDIVIRIRNVIIERVRVAKFIGVHIDELLNWNCHIKYVKSRLAKSSAILYRCSQFINRTTMYILYCAIFLPYITYCSEIWGNTYPSNIQCICLLQKRAVRIVCGAGRLAHTTPLFSKLHTLKFEDITKLKTLNFMHNAYYNVLPSSNLFFFTKKNTPYATRGINQFTIPRFRTTMRSMTICVYGVKLWNSLEPILTNLNCVNTFKYKCKNMLLSLYIP